MRLYRTLLAVTLLTLPAALVVACDKDDAPKGTSSAASAGATTSAAPAPTSTTPPAPSKPQLAVDDTGASVGSDRVDFASPDPKGALGVALGGKPVAGEELVLDAARTTKTGKVTTLFGALTAAKVKAVRVHTARRDGGQAELVFVLGTKLPDCAGVGQIGKDMAIRAWAAGGGAGARFSKGMAGPDNTLGSAGVRKVMEKCDAPAFGITADETVTWGLLVDLALAVTGGDDAGAPKAKELVLLPTSTVAGRKVDATL